MSVPTDFRADRFGDALVLANDLHASQSRKATGIPYITHLMAVAGLVGEAVEGSPLQDQRDDLMIAALLHDALEDQGDKISLEQIREQFGDLVAGIVLDCSDAVVESDQQEKEEWLPRKQKYIARVASKGKPTLLVSAADKLHNLMTIRADFEHHSLALFNRFKGKQAGTLWYYTALVSAFGASWPDNPLLPRLQGVMEDLVGAVIAAEKASAVAGTSA